MNQHLRPTRLALALCAGLAATAPLAAQPFGQWDFNSSNLVATVGTDLAFRDGPSGATDLATQFGTTTSFGVPAINGTNAVLLRFPASDLSAFMGISLTAPGAANGGGSLVNNYTLLLDVLYPVESNGKVRPLLETDQQFLTTEADLIVDAGNGIGGVPGPYHGTMLPNTWYRLAFVVDGEARQLRKYINGVEVGVQAIATVDSKFALSPGGVSALFANNTAATAAVGYVNSLQLRDVALNPGQVSALGGPTAEGIPQMIPAVPSFVQSRTPASGATGVGPQPNITVVLHQGDTTITSGSINIALDGVNLTTDVQATPPTYTATATAPAILDPNSTHTVRLTWLDSVAGNNTNTWAFTVANYQNLVLPTPFYLETFDSLAEGSLPAGWGVTNNTSTHVAGTSLDDVRSDSYKDFVVISSNRFTGLNFEVPRRLALPPIVVNGAIVPSILSGNFAYAESDIRSANQVQVMFTHDINCTGRSNVFVAWKSMYEQNQDNLGSVEYSVNGGVTWLPVIYYLDDQNQAADIIRTNGAIDVGATFGTPRGDQAYGLAYSNFIGAPVSAALIPYTAGRINDDNVEGKRVEMVRLPLADNAATVRFRFGQAGTASWYFGVDDLGLYQVNTPVITAQPQNRTLNATESTTFSVAATSGTPLTYRWQRNGVNLAEGANYSGVTTATLTVSSAEPADAGSYRCVVSNSDGSVNSALATLTVVDAPTVTAQPVPVLVSAGYPAAFTVSSMGRPPLHYQWLRDGTPVGGDSPALSLPSTLISDAGPYQVVITNATGATTSAVARLTVVSGAMTSELVAHLKFDNDYNDASGRGNAAFPVGTPTFNSTGRLGAAFQYTTTAAAERNYASLGYPDDLKFDSTNDFTIAFWSKVAPGSKSSDPAIIGNKNWGSGSNPGYVLGVQGNNNFEWNYREVAPNTRKDFDSPINFTDDGWHHVVFSVQRGVFVRTFVDGLLVNVQPSVNAGNPPTSIDTTLAINLGQDGTGTYGSSITNALLDDVGFWRRALTPQEAQAIYNASFSGQTLAQAAVGGPVPLPQITGQPSNTVVTVGGPASFTVTASGGVPLSYQWRLAGTNLPAATNRTYAIAAAGLSNAGNYLVVVSNPGGSVTSAVATLTVVSAPVIATQPVSRTNNQNLDVSFSVAAGGGGLLYQWSFQGAPLAGATNSALNLASIVPAQAGSYAVAVSNGGGFALSSNATLTVIPVPAPRITGQWDFNPGDLRATTGQALDFFNATAQTDTTFGSTTSFGLPDLAGAPGGVLRYVPSTPNWGGYRMFHGAAPNGGGNYVNQYTIIYDVFYPSASHNQWRALFQTATSNNNDGDFFINAANGVGISGNYQGSVPPATWTRIALAVDVSSPLSPAVAKFINGVKVGYQTGLSGGRDGRFSLSDSALIFADEDGENAETYVSSVQFWNGKLPDALIAAMGTPTAAKIPGSITATLVPGGIAIYRTGNLGVEQADTLNGPWTLIPGAANPLIVPASGAAKFFRPKF